MRERGFAELKALEQKLHGMQLQLGQALVGYAASNKTWLDGFRAANAMSPMIVGLLKEHEQQQVSIEGLVNELFVGIDAALVNTGRVVAGMVRPAYALLGAVPAVTVVLPPLQAYETLAKYLHQYFAATLYLQASCVVAMQKAGVVSAVSSELPVMHARIMALVTDYTAATHELGKGLIWLKGQADASVFKVLPQLSKVADIDKEPLLAARVVKQADKDIGLQRRVRFEDNAEVLGGGDDVDGGLDRFLRRL